MQTAIRHARDAGVQRIDGGARRGGVWIQCQQVAGISIGIRALGSQSWAKCVTRGGELQISNTDIILDKHAIH